MWQSQLWSSNSKWLSSQFIGGWDNSQTNSMVVCKVGSAHIRATYLGEFKEKNGFSHEAWVYAKLGPLSLPWILHWLPSFITTSYVLQIGAFTSFLTLKPNFHTKGTLEQNRATCSNHIGHMQMIISLIWLSSTSSACSCCWFLSWQWKCSCSNEN